MTTEEAIKIATGLRTDFKCESDTMVDFCNTIIKALEPCEDAVSREEAFEALNSINGTSELDMAFEVIEKLPSVIPTRKIGKWIEERDDYGEVTDWHCDKCYEDSGFTTDCKWDFCPNCGAKMESEDKE